MWTETLEYLKDPYLVARIQKFFGVEILDEREKRKKTDDDSQKIHNDDKQSTEDSSSSCNETHKHVQPKFRIRNYFWYYLFFFGTQLGDELFYTTFISFWFWNIDGAVGRRVVLVWATVMTIGNSTCNLKSYLKLKTLKLEKYNLITVVILSDKLRLDVTMLGNETSSF